MATSTPITNLSGKTNQKKKKNGRQRPIDFEYVAAFNSKQTNKSEDRPFFFFSFFLFCSPSQSKFCLVHFAFQFSLNAFQIINLIIFLFKNLIYLDSNQKFLFHSINYLFLFMIIVLFLLTYILFLN